MIDLDVKKDRKDIDGNPVTLDKLCRLEPAWAASRIRTMEAELEALRQQRDDAERNLTAPTRGHLAELDAELSRLRELERTTLACETWPGCDHPLTADDIECGHARPCGDCDDAGPCDACNAIFDEHQAAIAACRAARKPPGCDCPFEGGQHKLSCNVRPPGDGERP